jgi:hypothetical protein
VNVAVIISLLRALGGSFLEEYITVRPRDSTVPMTVSSGVMPAPSEE